MSLKMVFVAGLLMLGASVADAACRSDAGSARCDLAGVTVRFGAPTAGSGDRAWPNGIDDGAWRVLAPPPSSGARVVVDLQRFGVDPEACRRLGNETYCH